MFGFRGEARLDFLDRQVEFIINRLDDTGDDRKEHQLLMREMRANHTERELGLTRRLEGLEKHINNLYGWCVTLAQKHGLEAPAELPPDFELSPEEMEKRSELMDRLLTDPVSELAFNADDILSEAGAEPWGPVETDTDNADASTEGH